MTCTTCATPAEVGTTRNSTDMDGAVTGDGKGEGVTYDEGTGTKGRVLLSGPMSEVLREQMNIIFKRVPLDLDTNPADLNLNENVAMETIVQDEAVRNAFNNALNTPATSVVLHGFDVKTIKEHVERMHENRATSADLMGTEQINVIAATMDQILDAPGMSAYDLGPTDEVVLVNVPLTTNGDSLNNDTCMVKGPHRRSRLMSLPVEQKAASADYPSVTSKIEALERIMPGRKVHVGVENFVLSLIQRAA